MASIIAVSVLALAAGAHAQLEGRGFPDCTNGPLKNNTVCDTTAGENAPNQHSDLLLTP